MKTNPPDVCNEIPLEQTTSPTHVHATRSTLLPRFKRRGYKGIFNSKIISRCVISRGMTCLGSAKVMAKASSSGSNTQEQQTFLNSPFA